MTGTERYAAPEIYTSREQTPKVDIYGLGVTVMECFIDFPEEETRKNVFRDWMSWHVHLDNLLRKYAPELKDMLGGTADERPTARQLLQMLQTSDACAPTAMDWSPTLPQGPFGRLGQPEAMHTRSDQSTGLAVAVKTAKTVSPVKEAKRGQQKRGHRRGGSSRNGSSVSAGSRVTKRSLNRKPRLDREAFTEHNQRSKFLGLP